MTSAVPAAELEHLAIAALRDGVEISAGDLAALRSLAGSGSVEGAS